MKYEKVPFKMEKHYRLDNWDYSSFGYYFVTICCKNRNNILGCYKDVGTDLCVCSSEFGKECERIWNKIPEKFNNVCLDEYVIMPNHIHGIIIIKNNGSNLNNIDLKKIVIDRQEQNILNEQEQTQRSVPTMFGDVGLLGQIIRWFKTISTNEYINDMKKFDLPKFNKKIWQPRFYDRIIRSEKEYFAIKQYIKDNPKNYTSARQ